ncbi:thioesterase family protein [Hasllibacter sp. MH4015]|uniref:thioesterase family protein n=1 Tax=Hasllibacter sp. MH4015 TaxID=2854029 RepID=UPI001CD3BDE1|nr:thioesterase family protein [Hasllibacter sp. MH4015]
MAQILVYGDSNSHGTIPLRVLGGFDRHPKATRWPERMADRLGPGVEVICEGLPGRTTVHHDPVDGGNRNGAEVLPAILPSHAPLDVVVLMLGTNDLKPRFATSAFDIAKSVERLVGITRAALPEVGIVVVAPAPVRETGVLTEAFAGAEARQAGLEDHFAEMAARQGVTFVRAGDHVQVSDIDGVHWEAEDHVRFGDAMADILGGMLDVTLATPKAAGRLAEPDPSLPQPPVTLDRAVPRDWVDYNGHMNEAHYLTVFSDATDQMLDWAGMDAACVAEGHSVFTVETHIRHLDEVNIGDRIEVRTRVMEGGGKKLHVWHELSVGGRLCATGEQLLLHMDLSTRRSAPPRRDVAAWFTTAKEAHAGLPAPEGVGRFVGQRT